MKRQAVRMAAGPGALVAGFTAAGFLLWLSYHAWIVTGLLGLGVGYWAGRRAGRRKATYDAAREIARSRPHETLAAIERSRTWS